MFEKESAIAGEAARAAGEILMRMLGDAHHIVKKGEIDLVTEADLAAEKRVLEIVGRNFPGDAILAEETGRQNAEGVRTWLIDPLDGTTNYAHGFPFFAVSIALEVENEGVLGIVYNPCMNEFFEAAKGKGARLNGEPLRVSEIASFQDSLLATGFPYDVHQRPEQVMDLFEGMLVRAQGIRRLGSAALDLCYVAAGRLEGFWEQDLKPWDTAAGEIIVREAGGRVTTFAGKPYTPYLESVLASNGLIHDDMLEVVKGWQMEPESRNAERGSGRSEDRREGSEDTEDKGQGMKSGEGGMIRRVG
ncbi:MAG: inositol monophosphatase [Deltaproteobacteria bacterium]|nr:inositol monophosphatase [Deltaproteobacteria bacterium]